MLNKGAKPLPFSLPHPFIAKIGEELAAQLAQESSARPSELVA